MEKDKLDKLLRLDRLIKSKSGIKLDIGCGENKQGPDFVGMDMRPLRGVDIVHDVEEFPWPLPDESVLVAVCSHLVEHLNPHRFGFVNFMNELWRVLKCDSQVAIFHPYAGSPGYWQDPTHCNGINEITWAYFDPLSRNANGSLCGLYQFYKPKPWCIEKNAWSPTGNMNVVLRKRREDPSYYE